MQSFVVVTRPLHETSRLHAAMGTKPAPLMRLPCNCRTEMACHGQSPGKSCYRNVAEPSIVQMAVPMDTEFMSGWPHAVCYEAGVISASLLLACASLLLACAKAPWRGLTSIDRHSYRSVGEEHGHGHTQRDSSSDSRLPLPGERTCS